MTPDPYSDLRELIQEATRRKNLLVEIEQQYRTASLDLCVMLKQANDAGVSKAELGRALGVSGQRVVAMIKRVTDMEKDGD